MKPDSKNFSEEETAERRDEVIRRMANTPPRHQTKDHPQRKAEQTARDRAVPKDRARGKS